jgi:Glycosyl hydrolases family 18/HYDIN/CFA65/VesB-like, Ig-like domain/Cep192 domain 4
MKIIISRILLGLLLVLTIALSGTGTQPQLAATPSSATFGNVATRTSNSQTITLTNGGGASATISQASVSGTGFSATGLTAPMTIAAGGTATFNVVFAPTSAGSVSGSVSLVSNAPTSPTTIALSGTGVAPTFLVGANPTSLNFGNVNVGNSSSLSATLTNNGNSNVTVSSVTVTGTGFSASGVTSGTVLTPNQSATVNVAFAPPAAGSVTGSVSVVSNATNSPISITLTGSGQTTGPPGQWISGYYSSQNGVLPVSSIPWSKYTHVIHFAAAPGLDGSGNGNGTVELHYLSQADINAVIAARPAGKQVLVCIKDNDSHLSAFAQSTSPATIATFVSNIASFVNANQYDGVDIDWEQNINVTQYSDLLTRLRTAMPTKVITIAAGNWGGLPSVAGASYSQLDQINLMCYDMDSPANGYSWYNDALLQSGNAAVMTCDWRARAFTSAGVAASKIGIGIPFYGRRWPGVTLPLVNGSFNPSTVLYRDLVSDGTRWQPQYQFYDSIYKSDYLSILGLNEFVSYDGAKTINDAVAWQKSQGFGGFMTFTLEYEYLSNQTGNSRYPLSTTLCQDVFGTCP